MVAQRSTSYCFKALQFTGKKCDNQVIKEENINVAIEEEIEWGKVDIMVNACQNTKPRHLATCNTTILETPEIDLRGMRAMQCRTPQTWGKQEVTRVKGKPSGNTCTINALCLGLTRWYLPDQFLIISRTYNSICSMVKNLSFSVLTVAQAMMFSVLILFPSNDLHPDNGDQYLVHRHKHNRKPYY